jgi:adenosylmethionine-8-amino-7-oxononanoate aminotransferase
LIENVTLMGERLEIALYERFGNHRHVGDVRGRGLFWAVEFVSDRASKASFAPSLKFNERVKAEAMARGLAAYPMGGTLDGKIGDHIIVAPPYIVEAADIDTIVERLGDAVDAAVKGL